MKTLALIFVFISTIAFADPWEIPDIECNGGVCFNYVEWETSPVTFHIYDFDPHEDPLILAKYDWETKKWTFNDFFIEAINEKITQSKEFQELILRIVRDAGIFPLKFPEFDFDTFPLEERIPNSRYNGPCFKNECN